jgi:2,4-dienoyl-CoA reductase-like NADH-dependent reductase (Old Yellow Enzyme family)
MTDTPRDDAVAPPPDPFAPTTLGPITLRNRVVKAATFEGVVPEALVTEELIEFHRRPAAGGVGMTTVAYLAVSPEGRTHAECIWLRPEAVPGLARLADVVHAEGAKVSAQIGHAGPVANAKSNRSTSLAPSRSFNPVSMKVTRAVTDDDITRITLDYQRGARFMAEAGFDAIEIHLAHNYLLSSFLSPKFNKRSDHWGGSLEHRTRFARQVREAVDMPLILLGGINTRATIDRAMAEGFQFVAMGRALLREPDLVARMQTGEQLEGNCIHCNRCMPSIYSGSRCVLDHPEPIVVPAAHTIR